MKSFVVLLLLSLFSLSAIGQSSAVSQTSSIKWYTIQEAEKLNKKEPRPIFVDAYTDWCGWCKKMDRDTFTNEVISDLLNTRFYPVKFNAEGNESITFMGHTFINDGKMGKAHQLAVELLQGQLSYPTVVFLVEVNGKLSVSPVPGYKPPKDMEVLLSFFAEKAYENQKWEDYQKGFKGKIQ